MVASSSATEAVYVGVGAGGASLGWVRWESGRGDRKKKIIVHHMYLVSRIHLDISPSDDKMHNAP